MAGWGLDVLREMKVTAKSRERPARADVPAQNGLKKQKRLGSAKSQSDEKGGGNGFSLKWIYDGVVINGVKTLAILHQLGAGDSFPGTGSKSGPKGTHEQTLGRLQKSPF